MKLFKYLSKRSSVASVLADDIDALSGKLEFLIKSPQSGSIVPSWISKAKDVLSEAKQANFPSDAIKRFEDLIPKAEKAINIAQKIKRLEEQVRLITKNKLTPKVETWLKANEAMANDYMKKYPQFKNLLDSLLAEIEYARRKRD
jgi:hypothetical protein